MNKERISENEKDELLLIESAPQKALDGKILLIGLGILLCAVIFAVPKIYLSSTIYYLSRDINKLQTQSDLLHEENRRLQYEKEALLYLHLK